MGLIDKLLLVVVFLMGLVAGLGGFSLYDTVIDDPAVARKARDEGARAERALWQKEKRDAEAAAERRRAQAQEKIDAADLAVEMFRKQDRLRAAAFEAAMREQRDEDENAPVDRSACALPDRVWNALR